MAGTVLDGPTEVPLHGGRLACVMLGHRWQHRDADNSREHVEYVLRISWRPPDSRQRAGSRGSKRRSATSGTRVWLVARRFNDFHALHHELRRARAASDAGSSRRELPRFPSRHGMASLLLGRNRRDAFVASRERLLGRYLADLLALNPGIPSEPAVDRFLELSTRLSGVTGQHVSTERRYTKSRRSSLGGCQRADSHVGEEDEDDGDQDFQNAEWLDYQLKLRLMEMVDDSDDYRGDGPDSARVTTLLESVELLRPQLKQAARDPRHTAQATLVLKKFADSLGIFSEIRQRNQRRATR